MSLNFGQIPPLTRELAALERLKNRCHHVISVDIDRIFFKLAGNEDMHNIMNEFEFRPDRTTDYGVSCPWASKKYPYRPYNGENGVSTFLSPATRKWRGIMLYPPKFWVSVRPSAPTTILVSATPPTVLGQSFWNFTGVLRMVWRYAYCFFRILKLFFITFFAFLT